MKAMIFEQFGGPEVLQYVDVPDPVSGPHEIVVDVHAASVNPADGKVRQGLGQGVENITFPYILGRDFSGTVRQTGAEVGDFQPGDEVFGVLEAGREGTYAEALSIKAGLAAAKPEQLTHAQAAALALGGLTALVSLEDTAELGKGEKILIHGGAGGVGSFAVQLAHHLGAQVISTASARNHAYLADLGADQVIDYTARDFTREVGDCDVVFDLIGGEVHQKSYTVLKPGGRLVYIAPPPPGAPAPRDDVRLLRPRVGRDRKYLQRIVELVALGAVRPPEISLMPLTDAGKAHEEIGTGHVRGKIVLEVPR